MLAVKVRLRT